MRDLRIARGEQLRGYKVGFTNRSIWQRYNASSPMYGFMWQASVDFADEASGQTNGVALNGFCQPRIEPEAVFCFKSTPPANASDEDVFSALD